MTLSDIYMKVSQTCLKDDKGVYLGNEKIALDNGSPNCYIRRNGEMTVERLGNSDYKTTTPLKLVGAYPGGDPIKLETATIAALGYCNSVVTSSEITKSEIADSEGIKLEELTKFDGVAMVMITYTSEETKSYDPKCDYDIC